MAGILAGLGRRARLVWLRVRRFLASLTVGTYRRVLHAVAATVIIVVLLIPDVPARLLADLSRSVQESWRYWLSAFVVAALVLERMRTRALLRAQGGPSNSRPGRNIGVAVALPVIGAIALMTARYVYSHTPQGTAQSPATQAVQSAALVGGLLGAALTVWIGDRRRVHDAASLALDRERHDDEQFRQALLLLGHQEASVRVGAMHALDSLARTAPSRRQTVVDVLCAYLRQPFDHYEWRSTTSKASQSANPLIRIWQTLFRRDHRDELDREREVRKTALRIVTALLSRPKQTEESARVERLMNYRVGATGYELMQVRDLLYGLVPHAEDDPFAGADVLKLDLSGAALDDLVLRDCILSGALQAAHIHGRTELREVRFVDDCDLQDVTFHGPVETHDVEVQGAVLLDRARFLADSRVSWVRAERGWSFRNARFYAPAVLRRLKAHNKGSQYGAHFEGARFQQSATISMDGYVYNLDGCEFRGDVSLMIDGGAVHSDNTIFVSGQHACRLPPGWKLEHPGAARTRIVIPAPSA